MRLTGHGSPPFYTLASRSCKVIEITTSKTGKHGHAKVTTPYTTRCLVHDGVNSLRSLGRRANILIDFSQANITALDIFSGKKLEDIAPTSHNLAAPFGA